MKTGFILWGGYYHTIYQWEECRTNIESKARSFFYGMRFLMSDFLIFLNIEIHHNEPDNLIMFLKQFYSSLLNLCSPSNQLRHHTQQTNNVLRNLIFGVKQNINPLRTQFFRESINIYLHFVSYLHIDTSR